MLPPFIIEQIRKREKEEREHQAEQPRLELPLERRRRHCAREPRRVDVRVGDTDGICGWLLSPTRLSAGAARSPGSVRRGAGRHSSRSITEVTACPTP